MSVTKNRKEREWAQREQLIIDQADLLLRDKHFLGFNLDELAERVEYSKGTLYQHFESKEDIVLAVVLSHLKLRAELFAKGASYQGRSRERMCGIGMADRMLSKLKPHAFSLDQLVQTASLWEKTSERIQKLITGVDEKIMETTYHVMQQAFDEGDLPASGPAADHIITGLICISKGAHLLAEGHHLCDVGGNRFATEILGQNFHFYMDGLQWKPLMSEWDYAETTRRLSEEIFYEEVGQIGQL